MNYIESIQPKVRIEYGKFLDPIFLAYMKHEKGQTIFLSHEEVEGKIISYRNEWRRFEEHVLTGLQELLKLNFNQNIIDVYVVTSHERAFSNPMVIPAKYDADIFVDTLTHEIIHRIISDNAQGINFGPIFKDMFPDQTILSRNHIFVHAVHSYIYLDILKDEQRLRRNISRYDTVPENNTYRISWKVVLEKGYQAVLKDLQARYLEN